MSFAKDFVWGAATSAYQIEGAWAEDGRGPSIWDIYSQEAGHTAGNHTGDTACDHYHHFREDAALMREIGLKAYRFSISWPRLLPEGTGKSKVQKAYREVVSKFEIEYAESLVRRENPAAGLSVFDYLCAYLNRAKSSIQINTYESYHGMIYGKIRRYFEPKTKLTVGNLQPKDIEDFYDSLFADGVTANTVIHYHAIMRRAFSQAFKDGLIDANPFDRVDRPKKNKFHGENYSEDELKALLELTRSDPIYPAILLAGGLGLRRSEALGVRWSRIDWEQNTVLLDTKIVEYERDGEKIVEPVEEMKNKSSRRTLPLPAPVREMLETEREKQEIYRKMFGKSYDIRYMDFVCVDQLGRLIRPSYVTQHFSDIIKKYGLRKIRYHDLRHTMASILISHDVPLINVSNFLGHSDISTTANIYAHLDKASKQASADIITGIFDDKSEG